MRIVRLSLALALALAVTPVRADSPRAEPMPASESTSVQAFGAGHPACAEWTDGCVTCARSEGGLSCSTPGIACQPTEIQCRKPVK
jgi:hypothetical protein